MVLKPNLQVPQSNVEIPKLCLSFKKGLDLTWIATLKFLN